MAGLDRGCVTQTNGGRSGVWRNLHTTILERYLLPLAETLKLRRHPTPPPPGVNRERGREKHLPTGKDGTDSHWFPELLAPLDEEPESFLQLRLLLDA